MKEGFPYVPLLQGFPLQEEFQQIVEAFPYTQGVCADEGFPEYMCYPNWTDM